MTYIDDVAALARRWDGERARSQQTHIGVSELGGCRQAIGYKLTNAWATDTTDTWRAMAGTVLHDWLTELRHKANPDLMFDVLAEYRGVPGHPDEVDPIADRVGEWKFPRLSTSKLWQDDADAFAAKRMQAHTYAAGLVDSGILTSECTVVVAVFPVDGSTDDWWQHEEPFNRAIADQAAGRLAEVRDLIARDMPLPRDKPFTWCEQFCEFFTLCRGGTTAPENEPITDPELAAAVRRYGEVMAQIGPLEKTKKALSTELRGHRGVVVDETGAGWRVAMTKPAGTKEVPDMDAISLEYEREGRRLPTREVATSSPSLRVTAVKPPKEKP